MHTLTWVYIFKQLNMKLYNTSVSIEMVKNYEYKYIHKDKSELSQNYITGS